MKRLGALIGALVLLLVSTQFAAAQDTTIFFESFATLDNWTEIFNEQTFHPGQPCRGPDETPNWHIDGEALVMNIDQSMPCKSVIVTTVPLSLPTAHLQQVDMFVGNPDEDRNIILHWVDAQNYLGWHFFGDTIWLEQAQDGASVGGGSAFFNFDPNTTYQITSILDQSSSSVSLLIDGHEVRTFQLNSLPDVITNPGLGISVGAVHHSHVRFDSYRITDLSDFFAHAVVDWKQTDPRWHNQEYDSATRWSEHPTMGRWGCALTAAAQALHFHGIHNLDDGNELDPGTLNTWLQSQPDGYVADGLLNWRALTRLAHWHAQVANTPELEFSYHALDSDSSHQWLRHQLQLGRLPIVALPQHFVTVHGYGPGSHDIRILDPNSSAVYLSQLAQPAQSARLFSPSNTNLRALTVWSSPTLQPQLTQNGDLVSANTILATSPRGEPYRITDWQHLDGVNYELRLQSQTGDWMQVALYNDDAEAEQQERLIIPQHDESILITPDTHLVQAIPSAAPPLSVATTHLWLQQQRIRSPQIIQYWQQQQEAIAASETLEEASAVLAAWSAWMNESIRFQWTEPFVGQALTAELQRHVLMKFP